MTSSCREIFSHLIDCSEATSEILGSYFSYENWYLSIISLLGKADRNIHMDDSIQQNFLWVETNY